MSERKTYHGISENYAVTGDNFSSHNIEFLSEYDTNFSEQLAQHGLHLESWYRPSIATVQAGEAEILFDPVEGLYLPIISFTYFKDNQLEPAQRMIIWDGEGFGVFDGHEGQDPAQYLIGLQIGIKQDGIPKLAIPKDGGRRNFSMDCIMGGDRGQNPVDARTGKELTEVQFSA